MTMSTGFSFFFSSRRRHTRLTCDWSSDVCSSDLGVHRLDLVGARDVPAGGSTPRDTRSRRIEIGRASCRERVEMEKVAKASKSRLKQFGMTKNKGFSGNR